MALTWAKWSFFMAILGVIHSANPVIPCFVHRRETVAKTPHLDTYLASSTKYGPFGNNFVVVHIILRHLRQVGSKPKNRRGRDGDKLD